MRYLDFLLYVRVTPDFPCILSVVEFLELLAISTCMWSSECAMVDGSPLIPEILMFAFLLLWNLAVALMVEEMEVRQNLCSWRSAGELKLGGSGQAMVTESGDVAVFVCV